MQTPPAPPSDQAPPDQAPPDQAPTEVPESAPARASAGPRDLVISMIVLLVPVIALVAFFRFTGGDSPVVLPTAPVFDDARAAGSFPVVEPAGLASGWRAISAAFRRDGAGDLRVGYLTPAGAAAQLVESNAPSADLLVKELGTTLQNLGTLTEAGQVWQVYGVRDGQRALVWLDPARTTIVVGDADLTELRALAGALR